MWAMAYRLLDCRKGSAARLDSSCVLENSGTVCGFYNYLANREMGRLTEFVAARDAALRLVGFNPVSAPLAADGR
jgi:hypothetical protein